MKQTCSECDGLGYRYSNNVEILKGHLSRYFSVVFKSNSEKRFERKEAIILGEVKCWKCLGKGKVEV